LTFKKGSVPWNKGKKCPQLSGKNNGFYGRKHSEETKHKIASLKIGKRHTEKTKRQMSESRKGKHPSDETKRKLSRAKMGEKNPNYGKCHSEETRAKIRAARLKQVFPKRDTSIEVALQEELNSRNIEYEKHVSVCDVCQPDMVFPDKMVAVFADGDYWHNLPSYKIRDKNQNKVLGEEGWHVLRFWEHEIDTDVSRCVDVIEEVLY